MNLLFQLNQTQNGLYLLISYIQKLNIHNLLL